LAARLGRLHGTLVYRGTPFENHWSKVILVGTFKK
jgi:hypothetical protein